MLKLSGREKLGKYFKVWVRQSNWYPFDYAKHVFFVFTSLIHFVIECEKFDKNHCYERLVQGNSKHNGCRQGEKLIKLNQLWNMNVPRNKWNLRKRKVNCIICHDDIARVRLTYGQKLEGHFTCATTSVNISLQLSTIITLKVKYEYFGNHPNIRQSFKAARILLCKFMKSDGILCT